MVLSLAIRLRAALVLDRIFASHVLTTRSAPLPERTPPAALSLGANMSHGSNHRDPEDLFADTRMTFGEHIEELRWHLWRAILGFIVAMLASLFIGKPVLYYIIIRPVEEQLGKYYDKR